MSFSLLDAASIGIQHVYHKAETARAEERHNEQIRLAKEQHNHDIMLIKQTYLLDVFLNLEQHFQQLNADLISSIKESERDMFDQRNQQFQTIILSSSVMFSALSTVIIQGPLSDKSSQFLLVSYSLCCALSFALLFLSIVLCIELVSRASKFMYKRAANQTKLLRESLKWSNDAMLKLRKSASNEVPDESVDATRNRDVQTERERDVLSEREEIKVEIEEERGMRFRSFPPPQINTLLNSTKSQNSRPSPTFNPPFSPSLPKSTRATRFNEMDVDKEWSKHENEVYDFLKMREEINARAWIFDKDNSEQVKVSWRTWFGLGDITEIDTSKVSFEKFWRDRCSIWGELAIALFYAGSAMFLLSVAIFMWSTFYYTYRNLTSAEIAVCLIGVGILLSLLTVLLLRYLSPQTDQNDQQPDSSSHSAHSPTRNRERRRDHTIGDSFLLNPDSASETHDLFRRRNSSR